MTTEEIFDAAFSQHQDQNWTQAEALYRQVLAAEPRHADALHLLGVLAFQLGHHEIAERYIRAAIDVKPSAGYFANLGLTLGAAGKSQAAIAAFGQAVQLRDDFPEAHNNLANILRQTGNLPEAVTAYRRAVSLRPDFFEAQNNLGMALSDNGELDAAIAVFEQAISLHPNFADLRNNLGNVFFRKGEFQKAMDCWREALSLCPDFAEAHNNLGNAYKLLGQLDEAVAAFRQALLLKPDLPEAWNNIGVIFFSQRLTADAIGSYQQAIAVRPTFADPHYNLAIALHSQGLRVGAISSVRQAVALSPRWAKAHNNLGIWLTEEAKHAEALAAFDQAVLADGEYAEAYSNRGNVLRQMGRLTDAIASYQKAVALKPDSAENHNNLGIALKQIEQLDEADASFRAAMAIDGSLPEVHNNLGNVLKDLGRLDEAIACYDRALELNPSDAAADSNRIYTLHFHADYSADKILAEHQQWNRRHATALQSQIFVHENEPSPARRLRIGYVAPDFRDHCQSLFTIPLFSHHTHEKFEIFCYSDVVRTDAITDRLRGYADVWRPILGMTDAQVAELIRKDKIDILVDLTVHMAYNRLRVFAQKPAPVQVSWLGYPGTTGLKTMDYRLSDPYLDPPGVDANYSEKTIRLPDSFWCYDPLAREPMVNELPASKNGFITFGCLNNFCKVNDATLRLWAKVLRAVANSRLLLLAPPGSARSRVLEVLGRENIERCRIQFVARQPRARYLDLYHGIDIGLDTFPYNGHTTSLDSFWMGVPVVTKIGQMAVGRGGYSQLHNLGFEELVGESDEQFIEIASVLADDPAQLQFVRANLRNRLERSPLMDAARFARNIEAAYRQMWSRWAIGHGADVVSSRISPDGVIVHIVDAVRQRRTRRWRQAS